MWLTPVRRTMIDFEITSSPDRHASYFLDATYIEGIVKQHERLRGRLNVLYGITFILAFLVIAGGVPTDQSFEAFGVSVPLGLFSQQALAAVMAAVFANYVIHLCSLTLLYSAMQSVLERYGGEPWEFFAAKFDGLMLYTSLMRPKVLGYSSPNREVAFILSVAFTALATVLLHAIVCTIAGSAALAAARTDGDPLSIVLATFSLVSVVVAFGAFLTAAFIPMPYRVRTKAAAV